MAATYTQNGTNTPNGSHLIFTYTFPVLLSTDVKVALNGVTQATTKYAVDTAATKITFNNTSIDSTLQETSGAPKSGVLVRVFRETGVGKNTGDEDPKAVFASGSSIRASDLNNNFEQALFGIHELQERPFNSEDISDDAVTYAKIQNVTATDRVLGRDTAGAGVIEEIAPAALRTMINVEDGATADQSNAEIRAAVEAATDSNVFTDADHTKLNAIEASATADQSNAEIRAAVEAASDSNVFTDADHTKLNSIESSATADQTITEIKSLIAGAPLDASHLATDSVTTSEIADAELTTLAGMQSGTASVLAGGTALTATLAEINTVVDGKGVHTTISDSDAHYPTSGAVVDYVAAQIAPIGGLEVIADEDNFPAIPASGVVISIADVDGIVINGSGVCTTARTAGNGSDNVTINGFPTALRSKTLSGSLGLMVSSTGSSNTYNYHKLLGKEDDIEQLSQDISDFGNRYRVHAGEPSSNNDEGDLVYDTNANKMKVYDGSAWGEVTSTGDFKFLIPVDAGTTTAATWDGSDTSFDLKETTNTGSAASVTSVYQLMISVNGVIQKPNTGSWSGSGEGFYLTDSDTIRFATAPATGSSVFIVQFGSALSLNVPADDTVATAKIQNLAVSTGKIADQAVDLTKLPHGDGTSNGKFLRSNNGADPTWETVSTTPEGTAILSTGESGGTKFLREDGDGTSSWQAVPAGYTHPNHSGEVTSSGDGATVIASNVVDEDNLKVSNSPTNGYVLTAQSGNTGGMTWEEAASGSSADGCIWKNTLTISNNHTIAATEGAHSVGPITNNATVTVNGRWVIS